MLLYHSNNALKQCLNSLCIVAISVFERGRLIKCSTSSRDLAHNVLHPGFQMFTIQSCELRGLPAFYVNEGFSFYEESFLSGYMTFMQRRINVDAKA